MADLVIKQNDTYPPLQAQLSDASGPVNLTTADSVVLNLKAKGAGAIIGGGPCTITVPAEGRVTYAWTLADTGAVTVFDGEFQVNWGAGAVTTFPNNGYFEVQIMAELD